MSADRVGIADAIIAGMAGGDDDLERLACIVKRLDEDGYVIVPKEPTPEMIESAYYDALDEDAKGVWVSMVEAAVRGG